MFTVIIQKVMEILGREKTPHFDLLYSGEGVNDESYLISILKAIYRTIKYKHKVHSEKFEQERELAAYKNIYFEDVAELSLDLVLVLVQQVYKKRHAYNYLYILKIIFNVMLKNKDFRTQFVLFCRNNNFRYFDFVRDIFQSEYEELRLVAIDLIEFPNLPFDLLAQHYRQPSELTWLIDLFIYAIDGKDLNIAINSLQNLNQLMLHFDEKQMLHLFDHRLRKFFGESFKINELRCERFSFLFKRNPSQEYFFRMKFIVKSVEKFSELIRRSRGFIRLEQREQEGSSISLDFLDSQGASIFPTVELGSFVLETLRQLRYLKGKPWYHNLNTSSKNYNYLYNNKTYLCLCMDKLFQFLLQLLEELRLHNPVVGN